MTCELAAMSILARPKSTKKNQLLVLKHWGLTIGLFFVECQLEHLKLSGRAPACQNRVRPAAYSKSAVSQGEN
jgi:hypothetical protein